MSSRRRATRRLLLALALSVPAGVLAASAQAANEPPTRPISWQSAGDSYSSGEGIVGNQGDCAQSELAYGPLSALQLQAEGWVLESNTFTACTGHLVEDYFNARRAGADAASLWEWGRSQGGPEQVDIITMSFGGNDIGFADVLEDCLPVPDSWVGYVPTPGTIASNLSGCDTSRAELIARVDALLDPPTRDCSGLRSTGDAGFDCDLALDSRRGSIIDFYYDVVTQRLTGDGRLYVVGYPSLIAPVDQWPGWVKVACQGIKRGDSERLGEISEHLNNKLQEAVDRANDALGDQRVVFIDRYALYRDGLHELCGTGDDWLNGIALSRGNGYELRKQSSFHPNAAGHEATSVELVAAVKTSFPTAEPVPPPVVTAPSGRALVDVDISFAQMLLDVAGHGPLEYDGAYGPATTAAVSGFQEVSGLPATGDLDASTWDQLVGVTSDSTFLSTCGEGTHSTTVRPTDFMVICPGLTQFEAVQWTSWSPLGATGTGDWRVPCPGYECADGSSYEYRSVTLELRDPKPLQCGDAPDPWLEFNEVTILEAGQEPNTFTLEGPFC